ncbi:MAG: PAS domain S-box protein [Thermodesulfobacteriota bacterium]
MIELTKRRNSLLRAISELNTEETDKKDIFAILNRCCSILLENSKYCLVWSGKKDDDNLGITPITALTSAAVTAQTCLDLVEQVLTDMQESNPAARALALDKPVIIQDISKEDNSSPIRELAEKTHFNSYSAWPLSYNDKQYGVLVIHSSETNGFPEEDIDFLTTVIADITLALYAHDATVALQFEHDFNREIVDSVQALMVSVTPCGRILSFNPEAEKVTGFIQENVKDKYWVDVLLAPANRREYQQMFSNILKGSGNGMHFRAELETINGKQRIIDWHGSIKPDIEKGKVGMVLFGIDITDQMETDLALNRAIAKWENIFSTIQDPALIVTHQGIIRDANHATFTAARKDPEEIIGQSVCTILHGGRPEGSDCPLETHLTTGVSRIVQTELRGLHGNYLLTISPLNQAEYREKLTLLVARDLTEEELMKAEAMRAAQLASIGELAAGVAHEINNPINGIINYAQMLSDLAKDDTGQDIVQRIIVESKRISAIVHNLLDFSHNSEGDPEPVEIAALLEDCISLVGHQLKKDHITIETNLQPSLPRAMCNGQQIQQVILNILSNSRYALNQRYKNLSPEKRILISGEPVIHADQSRVRITITDYGTGIESHIMDRIFDPFFSTKPTGDGTGLGLSISHGLMQDNNGFLRIKSEVGKQTSLILDLPAIENGGMLHER